MRPTYQAVSRQARRAEVERIFTEALAFHLEGLRLDGLPIPPPVAEAGHVAVPA